MNTPAVTGSGTQTAVVGNEIPILVTSAPGIYQLWLDIAAMQSGDTVEVRAKTNILSAGTVRVVFMQVYNAAAPADDAVQLSIPIPADQPVTFTLKQTAGTGRDFPWKVLAL